MKGLRCSAGGLRCACCCAYKSLPLKRQPACFIHSTENECGFLCLCVPMLENQYMAQWFWQFSSQCYPIPKSNCLSSFSISPSSVLYCPTACLLSKQHFRSQNKPIIFLPDRRTNQPIVLWVFELPLLLSWVCVCVSCFAAQTAGCFLSSRNLKIGAVMAVHGWWFGRLPSAPYNSSFSFRLLLLQIGSPSLFRTGVFSAYTGDTGDERSRGLVVFFHRTCFENIFALKFFMVSSNFELIVWFSLEGCRKISILWLIPHV